MVFDAGSPDTEEEGGIIYDISRAESHASADCAWAVLKFGPGQVEFTRVKVCYIIFFITKLHKHVCPSVIAHSMQAHAATADQLLGRTAETAIPD